MLNIGFICMKFFLHMYYNIYLAIVIRLLYSLVFCYCEEILYSYSTFFKCHYTFVQIIILNWWPHRNLYNHFPLGYR